MENSVATVITLIVSKSTSLRRDFWTKFSISAALFALRKAAIDHVKGALPRVLIRFFVSNADLFFKFAFSLDIFLSGFWACFLVNFLFYYLSRVSYNNHLLPRLLGSPLCNSSEFLTASIITLTGGGSGLGADGRKVSVYQTL